MTGFGSMFIMDGLCFVVVDLGHGDIMCIHCGECYGESMENLWTEFPKQQIPTSI